MTERFGLLDYVFSRKVIPTLFENLFKDHALHIAGDIAAVLKVRPRQVLGKEGFVILHALVVAPLRVRRILLNGADDNALGILEPGGLQRPADRTRWEIDDDFCLPTDLSSLTDRLCGEFGCAG